MAHFAVRGMNHETFGFDHRLCEWRGARKLKDGKLEEIKLEGRAALNALIEAKNNVVLESLSTGAVAMAPMACHTTMQPKKSKRPIAAGKSVAEQDEKPYNSITGEVDKGKKMISDENKPAASDKAAGVPAPKAKGKTPWQKPWEKDKEPKESTDESAAPDSSKKSTAIHKPRMAGLRPPVRMESATPEDISRLITEDPDLLSEGPIGGDHDWPELDREDPVSPDEPTNEMDGLDGPSDDMPMGDDPVGASTEPHMCSECGKEHTPEPAGGSEMSDELDAGLGDLDDMPEAPTDDDLPPQEDDHMSPDFNKKAHDALSDEADMSDQPMGMGQPPMGIDQQMGTQPPMGEPQTEQDDYQKFLDRLDDDTTVGHDTYSLG